MALSVECRPTMYIAVTLDR